MDAFVLKQLSIPCLSAKSLISDGFGYDTKNGMPSIQDIHFLWSVPISIDFTEREMSIFSKVHSATQFCNCKSLQKIRTNTVCTQALTSVKWRPTLLTKTYLLGIFSWSNCKSISGLRFSTDSSGRTLENISKMFFKNGFILAYGPFICHDKVDDTTQGNMTSIW